MKMMLFAAALLLALPGCASKQPAQRQVPLPPAWAMVKQQSLVPKLDKLLSISEPGSSSSKPPTTP